jgi:hypothetical protein
MRATPPEPKAVTLEELLYFLGFSRISRPPHPFGMAYCAQRDFRRVPESGGTRAPVCDEDRFSEIASATAVKR